MKAIKPGDVVKLKSGGRPMAVEAVECSTAHVCAERDGQIVKWQVNIAALCLTEPSKGNGYVGAI